MGLDSNAAYVIIPLAVGATFLTVVAARAVPPLIMRIRGRVDSSKEQTDNYPLKSIDEAVASGDDVTISGVVKELYPLSSGYSGVIASRASKVPFYFGDDAVEYVEQTGLVPILLNASLKTETAVRMPGYFDQDIKIFIASGLEAVLDKVSYSV